MDRSPILRSYFWERVLPCTFCRQRSVRSHGFSRIHREWREITLISDFPLFLQLAGFFEKIRNLTVRHISDETLFPLELSQYDSWVMREILHNCIAHQDYLQGARISIVENDESLLFTNRGEFIPGSVDSLITSDSPPDHYRNPFLAQAMVNLNMIDTIGSGSGVCSASRESVTFPCPIMIYLRQGKYP